MGDLNHDGKPDIVTTQDATQTLGVLINNGTGEFSPEQNYSIDMNGAWGVAVADFNNDDNNDVAVGASSPLRAFGQSSLAILYGNGDETLNPPKYYDLPQNATNIAAGDLNGDGKADLVIASETSMVVLLGNGDGTFQNENTYGPVNNPYDIAIADFNNDGTPDISVNNYGSNTVTVFLGNGDGTFAQGESYPIGTKTWGIATGDLNHDGYVDIVTTNAGCDTQGQLGGFDVLLGNGDGSFQPASCYSGPIVPTGIAVADVNGDQNPDVIILNTWYANNPGGGTVSEYPFDSVGVYIGKGDGTFKPQQVYITDDTPGGLAVADINNDAWPDLLITNFHSKDVNVIPHLNPPPTITTTQFNALSGKTLNGELKGDDHFGLQLNFKLGSNPKHGTANISPTGQFSYTSDDGFEGNDSFIASVSNEHASSQSKVHITVSNKPPSPEISTPGNMTIQESVNGNKTQGGPESFTVDGTGTLTVSASSNNAKLIPSGNIVVSPRTGAAGKRQITVYPAAGESGNAELMLTVKDTYGQNESTSFRVKVLAAQSNPPPPNPPPDKGSSGGGSFATLGLWLLMCLTFLRIVHRRFQMNSRRRLDFNASQKSGN